MATNEILQFASTNTGTNLLTQTEYAADAQRTTGNQPGIARSKLVNKALRQSSLLAAGLAEFIADYQANNVTDSLTPQNIADYLLAAIQANIPVVPDASTTVKGKIQLATATQAQAFADALLAITPSTLNQALKGSNQTLNSTGYQKFPGGLILQWGKLSIYASGGTYSSGNVTFPIAFPNAIFVASANANESDYGNQNDEGWWHVRQRSTTGMTCVYSQVISTGGNELTSCDWIAIGY